MASDAHDPAGAIAALCAAIDELLDVDRDALDDASTHAMLTAVLRGQARLGVLAAETLGSWDTRGIWRNNGSRSPAHRYARETRSAVGTGRAALRRARALPNMPHTRRAVLDGVLSWDHVDLFERACTPERRELFVEGEETLVAQCVGAPFFDAVIFVRYWEARADAKLAAEQRERDGADHDRSSAQPTSKIYASRSLDDRLVIQGELDPIDGAIVVDELDRLVEQIRLADVAAGIDRTPAQRRAAAMVEMAKRSATAPADGRRPQPLFTVLVGDKSFEHVCELANGTVLRTGDLVPYLDAAMLESVIFDGPITVVGVSQRRTFVGALRRAVLVRDRRCRHTSECDVPASKCDVDHILPWVLHGETSQFNGRAECRPHNRIPELQDTGVAPLPPRRLTYLDVLRIRLRWKYWAEIMGADEEAA